MRAAAPDPAPGAAPPAPRAPRGLRAWAPLLLLAAAFLLLFWWQRSRSDFLRIEAERGVAIEIAADHGLQLADVFALRDLIGPDADRERLHAAAAAFANWHAERGAALAAVMVAADSDAERAVVDEALRAADGDAERAWQDFRLRAEALPGLRFLAMRERFAARSAKSR